MVPDDRLWGRWIRKDAPEEKTNNFFKGSIQSNTRTRREKYSKTNHSNFFFTTRRIRRENSSVVTSNFLIFVGIKIVGSQGVCM